MMNIERFVMEGKDLTLYKTEKQNMPLVVLNNYAGDGRFVVENVENMGHKDLNLLCISNLNWDHDMTPWYCPPLTSEDTPCTGGADEYLALLLEKLLPDALDKVSGSPAYIGIAGYSLGGLFALYALYHTDVFNRAASMSGSLWFPDFKDYALNHSMVRKPDKLYISLGDKEARTRNHYLKTVQDNTESIVDHYCKEGIDVTWELNPGNHFKDPEIRSAKGIVAIL